MKIGTKTMIGKLEGVRYHGKHYTVEGEYSNPCLSKDEFRAVMLPRLTQKQVEVYESIGDNRKQAVVTVADMYANGRIAPEDVYPIMEAIVKGGYNHD